MGTVEKITPETRGVRALTYFTALGLGQGHER